MKLEGFISNFNKHVVLDVTVDSDGVTIDLPRQTVDGYSIPFCEVISPKSAMFAGCRHLNDQLSVLSVIACEFETYSPRGERYEIIADTLALVTAVIDASREWYLKN